MIEVSNLKKTYKYKTRISGLKRETVCKNAVNDISFKINTGEIVGFIGPNGSGKSTTIKMLSGILYPTSGLISIMGLDPIADRKRLSYQLGTVFGQKSQLSYHLSPRESFILLSYIYDIDRKKFNDRLNNLTNIFQLSSFMDSPVRKLSLGQRIRCEIVASILHEPKIIFLDEPTIGLDTIAKHELRELLRKICLEDKVTVLITSHDLVDIEKLCDRVLIIQDGSLICDKKMDALKTLNAINKKILDIKFNGILPEIFIPNNVRLTYKSDYEIKMEIEDISMFPAIINFLNSHIEIIDVEITST